MSADLHHSSSRSWRDIPQPIKPRAMSREGQRRLVLATMRISIVSLVAIGVLWGAWQVSRVVSEKKRHTIAPGKEEVVTEIMLLTDGTLDRAWIVNTLALPKNATLLGLDLVQLRSRVLAHGQVINATVERKFPSTLVVRATERSPVARVMASMGEEPPQVLLIARDGVVFPGVGFDPAMLDTLPWLDGVKLIRSADGFTPIAGMPVVAELLAKAKLEAEHLYQAWHVVSLGRLASDGEIEVHTKNDALRVRFATNQDFYRQLSRLDWLIDATQRRTGRLPREIDLASGPQVPVVLAAAEPDQAVQPGANAAAAARPPTGKSFAVPAFPNFSSPSKNKREF